MFFDLEELEKNEEIIPESKSELDVFEFVRHKPQHDYDYEVVYEN